ncbi:hypothetical protein L210DRAFT_3534516 [Boletus edulis BED1]|uniref:Uncharacterized protein n=1 Tax=Boletus edulis BED1 TaxID=1328754 RepID=A0AAD4BY44_BOLED|nr:hypothetical protein L210DRAFT_3534516 [Boletus edulis BED1]
MCRPTKSGRGRFSSHTDGFFPCMQTRSMLISQSSDPSWDLVALDTGHEPSVLPTDIRACSTAPQLNTTNQESRAVIPCDYRGLATKSKI